MNMYGIAIAGFGIFCLGNWRPAFINVIDRLKSAHPVIWANLGQPNIGLLSESGAGNANLMWFIFSRKHRDLDDRSLSFKCDLVLAVFVMGPTAFFVGVLVVLLQSPIFHAIHAGAHA